MVEIYTLGSVFSATGEREILAILENRVRLTLSII